MRHWTEIADILPIPRTAVQLGHAWWWLSGGDSNNLSPNTPVVLSCQLPGLTQQGQINIHLTNLLQQNWGDVVFTEILWVWVIFLMSVLPFQYVLNVLTLLQLLPEISNKACHQETIKELMLQLHRKVNKMLQVIPLPNAATWFRCNVPESGLRQKMLNKLTATSTYYKTTARTRFPLISKQLGTRHFHVALNQVCNTLKEKKILILPHSLLLLMVS